MARKTIDGAQQKVLEFVDNESTTITQALQMAAETNEADAKVLEGAGDLASAQLMRDSAASWRAKAQRFARLCEALPAEG